MEKLDLHGFLNHDIELEVKNFLFLNEPKFPVKIITGKSDKMNQLVVDILRKNGYNFEVPAHNSGEIIVYY
jgi:hypothetical protein